MSKDEKFWVNKNKVHGVKEEKSDALEIKKEEQEEDEDEEEEESWVKQILEQ